MSTDPPDRTPGIVLAIVRRLSGPPYGEAGEQQPPQDLVMQLVGQVVDVGFSLATLTRPTRDKVRRAVRGGSGSGDARGSTPQRSTSIRSAAGEAEPDSRPTLGVLALGPVRPGGKSTAELRAHNESREGLTLYLHCGVLQSATGSQVPGNAVTVEPTPVDLAPRSVRTIEVIVDVPNTTPPGRYTGLMSDADRSGVRALVDLEVG